MVSAFFPFIMLYYSMYYLLLSRIPPIPYSVLPLPPFIQNFHAVLGLASSTLSSTFRSLKFLHKTSLPALPTSRWLTHPTSSHSSVFFFPVSAVSPFFLSFWFPNSCKLSSISLFILFSSSSFPYLSGSLILVTFEQFSSLFQSLPLLFLTSLT